MRSLRTLPVFNKPPGSARLLDIALLLALAPHLFLLKAPMLLYLFLALLSMMRRRRGKTLLYVFMLLGAAAVAMSFFSQYTVASLSRMLVFVSLIVSMLIYAVTLQRLSRTVNFYLLISPVLLFVLAFFFYNSITMLFYALFTLFVFVLLVVWHRMQSPLAEALRVTFFLFALALPVVALLFVTFPRISFEKATFGFKGEKIMRTGHDGTMHLDSSALLVPSPRVVMEVWFDEGVPESDRLYFRGSVLYEDDGSTWETLPSVPYMPMRERIAGPATPTAYNVTLYPHKKRWLYMLDVPLFAPPKSRMDSDFVVRSEKEITETKRYRASSAIAYRALPLGNPHQLDAARVCDPRRDPRTAEALAKTIDTRLNDVEKAKKIVRFFKERKLTYSLKPGPLDLEHPTDSFLFGTRTGYCVHFAAAFANAARLAGLPSRIVTGYKADRGNALESYLVVREADAHAWVELYLRPLGWVRFEPTALAHRYLLTPYDSLNVLQQKKEAVGTKSPVQRLWKQGNLYFLYAKYVIDTWILEYSRSKQTKLLQKLLHDTLFLAKFAAGFALLLLFSAAAIAALRKGRCTDEALCAVRPLIKALAKHGLQRSAGETMHRFFLRAQKAFPEHAGIGRADALYQRIKYAKETDKTAVAKLREEARRCSAVFKK
jgi:transglutaminase-like putative cysteine protease